MAEAPAFEGRKEWTREVTGAHCEPATLVQIPTKGPKRTT